MKPVISNDMCSGHDGLRSALEGGRIHLNFNVVGRAVKGATLITQGGKAIPLKDSIWKAWLAKNYIRQDDRRPVYYLRMCDSCSRRGVPLDENDECPDCSRFKKVFNSLDDSARQLYYLMHTNRIVQRGTQYLLCGTSAWSQGVVSLGDVRDSISLLEQAGMLKRSEEGPDVVWEQVNRTDWKEEHT